MNEVKDDSGTPLLEMQALFLSDIKLKESAFIQNSKEKLPTFSVISLEPEKYAALTCWIIVAFQSV